MNTDIGLLIVMLGFIVLAIIGHRWERQDDGRTWQDHLQDKGRPEDDKK